MREVIVIRGSKTLICLLVCMAILLCLTVFIVMQGFLDLFILALIDVGDQKLVVGVMCIFLFAMDYPQESEIGEMTTLTVMGCVRVCVWVCGCVCVCVCVFTIQR